MELITEFFELSFSEDQLGFLRIWNLSIAWVSCKDFINAMSGYEYWIWYPRSLQYFVLWLSDKISLASYSDLQLVNTSVHLSICNQLMLVQASMCVCVCSLLLLHSCLFNILTYCISCGEEPSFPGMVLDCMITVWFWT